MSTSRRNFLKNSTMVALAAGVPLTVAERLSAGTTGYSAPAGKVLTKSAFESALNTSFLINTNSTKVPVKLVSVRDLGSKKNGKEAFSLMFRGNGHDLLDQDTYSIEHESLGTFSFLIVPMKRDNRDRPRYEAVVNRLH